MTKVKLSEIKKLGIIGGFGSLPKHVYDACIKSGVECMLICLEDQASISLFEDVKYYSYPVHAVTKMIKKMKEEGVTHVTLAGKVERSNLSKLLLDLKGAVLLAKIVKAGLNDNAVLVSIINFLEREGFILVPPELIAKDIIVYRGVLTKSVPNDADWNDINKGIEILKSIAEMDVGQAIIIQSGLVLGVEAAEGTDELIKRCGLIKQKNEKGPILVKLMKPSQDRRVDLPCIGADTIKRLSEYGIKGVAVQSSAALMLDSKRTIDLANEASIFIVGF